MDAVGIQDGSKQFTHKQIMELWPQAAAELAVFARTLDVSGMGLTAAQLRMAIQLANATFQQKQTAIDELGL